jgi:hypothetical protein
MGSTPTDGNPIKLSGAFFTLCAILRFIVASAAEAKLGALFLNCKEGMIFRMTLKEMGHPQCKTLVHCNNAMAIGNANNTVKRQRSRSMEMRYFGFVIKFPKMCMMSNTTLGSKIWHTARVNTTQVHITKQYAPGIYMKRIHPWYYQDDTDLAL